MKYKNEGPWTRFMDMHSGGGQKLEWAYIYIQAPEQQAKSVFYVLFGRNPDRVTCTCCGADYSIDESPDLEQAVAFNAGWKYDPKAEKYIPEAGGDYSWRPFLTVEQYLKDKSVKVITSKEFDNDDRFEEIPKQGYVWID